jgi:hypothetical protein
VAPLQPGPFDARWLAGQEGSSFGRALVDREAFNLWDLESVEIQFHSSIAVWEVDYEACVAPSAVDVRPEG